MSSTFKDINTLSCILGSISLIASIVTIRMVLIHPKNNSGYLLLILSLATTQIADDIGHIIIPSNGIRYTREFCNLKGNTNSNKCQCYYYCEQYQIQCSY